MATPAETLRRTPLYARHAAAGAKLRPVRRLGDAGPVPGHPRGAPGRPAAAAIFDVSHMGEIETRGPQALTFLQRVLSNDVAKIADAARSTASCAARTAASWTTCSPTASARTAS
jgi:aminomethyltransferase